MSFWNPEYDRLRNSRAQWLSRNLADQAKSMPLTVSESYWPTRTANESFQKGWIAENERSGRPAPTPEELQKRYPIPESPFQSQLQQGVATQQTSAPVITAPAASLLLPENSQPAWPIAVPGELIRTGGAGGGFRDSNIQDATGLTGGGALLTGGAGGGQRDSNIQDATGTTGGNAGGDVAKKPFDWDGLSSGFAMIGKGMKGGAQALPDMRAPSLMDDSGQRMAAASQLWQAVMSKRKPKGLI